MNLHPLLIVLGVAVAVSLVGMIIAYARSGATLRGYQEIARDADLIANKLRAEKFRDGDDLVINGNLAKLPAVVRFSYSENTPGLNIQMKAPATFTLSVTPKGARSEGRVPVRTGDDMFDARFVTRTDQPTQAKMFLTGKLAMKEIQKLCCSSKTFLTLSPGAMELSELVIPENYTGKHVNDHLDSLAQLAAALKQMPGADTVKITPYAREKSRVLQASVAVLAITGVLVVASALRENSNSDGVSTVAAAAEVAPAEIPAKDAEHIVGASDWRLAGEDDFDPQALGWLHAQHNGTISGRFSANFAGADKLPDGAYILVSVNPRLHAKRRVIVMQGEKPLFDVGYAQVAVAGVVAQNNFSSIQWRGNATAPPPDGDGLLIVRDANDPASGLVIYSSGGRMETATPANYQSVSVE